MSDGLSQAHLALPPLIGVVIGGLLAAWTQARLDKARHEREHETSERLALASARVLLDDLWGTEEWVDDARKTEGRTPKPPRVESNEDDFRRLAASDALQRFKGDGFGRVATGRRAMLRARDVWDQQEGKAPVGDQWDRIVDEMRRAREVLVERFRESRRGPDG